MMKIYEVQISLKYIINLKVLNMTPYIEILTFIASLFPERNPELSKSQALQLKCVF